MIAPQRERDFSALVEKAKIAEEWPKKKAKVDGPVRAGPPVTVTGLQPYTDCGRLHQRECWRRTGVCLRCGSLEHRIRECPLRADQRQALDNEAPGRGAGQAEARQPALVYAARRQEDGDAPDVVTGTFYILDVPYIALTTYI
ncbi:uncharacterized protein LOC128039813 [Gossypium raimondii]|uniref:uncharacterized protein LOC128039813 n=1 Tax=Gossypium raimondii TaxID=29730 RepID=UPI00227D6EE5|nr:uncharacterized protein LOC128039813 [Gossypium raimondii]